MIGLALAAAGGLAKFLTAAHQNKLANQIVIPDANYTVSPYALNTLATSKQMFNSDMPGVSRATQNLQNNAANQNSAILRGATDAGQALALMASTQGLTDKGINDLQLNEANYKMQAFNNLANANEGMTSEMDKLHEDAVRQQMLKIQEKNALRGAAGQNFGNGMNELTSTGFMLDNYFAGQKRKRFNRDLNYNLATLQVNSPL